MGKAFHPKVEGWVLGRLFGTLSLHCSTQEAVKYQTGKNRHQTAVI